MFAAVSYFGSKLDMDMKLHCNLGSVQKYMEIYSCLFCYHLAQMPWNGNGDIPCSLELLAALLLQQVNVLCEGDLLQLMYCL